MVSIEEKKVRNMTIKHAVRLFLMTVSIFFCAGAFGGFVDLKVVGAYPNATLEIDDSDVKCGNDKNCIKTTKGSELDLDFKLQKACNNNGPEYKLTGMQFSMVESEPDGAGGVTKPFGKYPLPTIVTSDFDLNGDGDVIWDGANNNKLTDDKIKLKNRNEGKYAIFFKIQATHCTDSTKVIYLDPRIENTGK